MFGERFNAQQARLEGENGAISDRAEHAIADPPDKEQQHCHNLL